jgi:phage shock protein A
MAGKIEQMEAEAEASAQLNEEYSGDVLAHKFSQLEQTQGAEEDLVALKRRMGVLPPEAPKPEAKPVRVEQAAEQGALNQAEQDELARALAELESEEQEQLRAKSRA